MSHILLNDFYWKNLPAEFSGGFVRGQEDVEHSVMGAGRAILDYVRAPAAGMTDLDAGAEGDLSRRGYSDVRNRFGRCCGQVSGPAAAHGAVAVGGDDWHD